VNETALGFHDLPGPRQESRSEGIRHVAHTGNSPGRYVVEHGTENGIAAYATMPYA
jgi:hypothetical protein